MKVDQAIKDALSILELYLPKFTEKFKGASSVGDFYQISENVGWTTGFLTGQYWLAYELTQKECFKDAALLQVDDFFKRVEEKIDVDHHDMGFLYSPSCVAAYKLAGSEVGKRAAILAADQLVSRFQEKGQFIQAWGESGKPENYRLIVDCLLNLPLLYWASDVTNKLQYKEIADKHIYTALACLVRPDFSTYHTYYFDTETGQPLEGASHQGYDQNSYWARGQAWGIYGIALAYRYTKRQEYLELFEKVTDFFFEKLTEDYLPYWDLIFSQESNEPKDSSTSAIVICGILDMMEFLSIEKAKEYQEKMEKLLQVLVDTCAVKNPKESNGLLLHGVYGKKTPYNTLKVEQGVDECNGWGDYFYLEAIVRLKMNWNPYW